MSFFHPLFLIGLAAAAAPVLIHLLTRDRVQHVSFSTLRFFAKGAKMVVRRQRFRELLLLLARALMAALLAVAFARPFFAPRGDAVSAEAATARVVVADVSGSMQRPGLAGELAKKAQDAMGSLRAGEDAGAVVTFAGSPQVREAMGKDLERVQTAATSLAPGFGATDISAALRKANELLRGYPAEKKEIVLLSDLQRSGWGYFKGDWKLAEDVQLSIPELKAGETKGAVAIVEASVPQGIVLDGQPTSISVRVANFSDQPVENLEVTLAVGDKKIETQKVNIRPKGSVAVRFRHLFDTPGDHPGTVTVGAEPIAPGLATFYFNARALPRIPVLVVSGETDPAKGGAFFISRALAPGEDSPFQVTTVPAQKVTAAEIGASRVVVLSDVGALASEAAAALTTLLERGGGVFFLPGGRTKADEFNRQFGTTAPFKLRSILQARPANGEEAESLTRIDFEHPVFEVFAHPHHGDLSLPKFAQYWETTDTQLSRVLARFGDGRPAVIERPVGNGLAFGLVSGIDPQWNDFSHQSVFLPFLHEVVRRLAVRTEQPSNFQSGDLLPVPEGSVLNGPDGKALNNPTAGAPGFYWLVDSAGRRTAGYAVNGSFAEADPAVVAADEILAAIGRVPGEAGGDFADGATGRSEAGNHSRIWWFLLCGLLGLALAELTRANHTRRH